MLVVVELARLPVLLCGSFGQRWEKANAASLRSVCLNGLMDGLSSQLQHHSFVRRAIGSTNDDRLCFAPQLP